MWRTRFDWSIPTRSIQMNTGGVLTKKANQSPLHGTKKRKTMIGMAETGWRKSGMNCYVIPQVTIKLVVVETRDGEEGIRTMPSSLMYISVPPEEALPR